MATRLHAVVMDTADPVRVGRFWADALGWSVLEQDASGLTVGVADAPLWGDGGPPALVFVPVPEPRTGKNRVHLDLASESLAHQQATVARLLDLGANRVDIGQEATPWVVMGDPEGNEFCVLDPRDAYRDTGPIAAVVVDSTDPVELANFWMKATGWPALRYSDDFAALRDPRQPTTWLELLGVVAAKSVKNRVHLDVAPRAGDDLEAEVARLLRAGSRRVDVGQGDVAWVVMADPEGNEFCVLPPPT